MNTAAFQNIVRTYYRKNARDLPWRKTKDPYRILVSEIMLQQTQVPRVVDKYKLFIKTYPTIQSLSRASASSVLKVWSGLGYNRRAILLHKLSRVVMRDHHGSIPNKVKALDALPGIGHATAAAICVYAYNQPITFIETNIRSVYIHHFYAHRNNITDKDIAALVTKTLDTRNPREWYWALMDYGTMLKRLRKNPSRRSAAYIKQSTFKGSLRQLRGIIIKALIMHPRLSLNDLRKIVKKHPASLQVALQNLRKDGLLVKKSTMYSLSRK